MIVIFNDTLGAYGGGQTLMLRMCIWLEQNMHRSVVFCRDDANSEIVQKLKKNGTIIECFDTREIKKTFKKLNTYLTNDKVKVFSLSWNYYLDMEIVKQKTGIKFENYLYCIHHETFKKGLGFKSTLLKNYSKKNYQSIFLKMNNNGNILMMDEVYLEEAENYLGLSLANKPKIIRLPMICNSVENVEKIISTGYESRIIMTAARAEFPFKGYLLSLVDDFVQLKKKYRDIKLEIVSDGDDISRVIEKIKRIPSVMKDDVILHRWLSYDALKTEIEKCFIMVGTGTTVLDAGLKYKPAVPVAYNTYENFAENLLGDDPQGIFPSLKCRSAAKDIIAKTLNFSFDEYRIACEASYHAVLHNYNIEVSMSQLMSTSVKNEGSILSFKECIRHRMNNILNRIRYRKNNFDYNQLKVEKS